MKVGGPDECGLLDEVTKRAYDRIVPLNVSLELTLRCNLRCTHCYNFDRNAPRAAADPELSFDEILRLMDDLRRAGTLFLALTGGEAMMHPRFWDIADAAAERSFALLLLSNGTLLTPAACDRLAAYPNLWGVSLSLYGARPETHDAVTGKPGSFRRTMDGARALRDRGATAWLKFILMKSNAAETAGVLELGEATGLTCSIDTTVTGRYDGTAGSLEDRVDHATLEALYRGPLRSMLVKRPEPVTDDDWRCLCARGNAAVSAGGDVHPCIAAPVRAGNIREQPFGEIWERSEVFRKIRGLAIADYPACAPCGLKPWCQHSSGPAYVHSGEYTGVDPWTCREAEILKAIDEETR